MRSRFLSILLFVTLINVQLLAQQPASPLGASFEKYIEMRESSTFGLEWISMGPVVNSARVESVQADPTHPGTMYVAFGSGNLWKTTNNGISWKPIFEDQPVLGIGDIALAPSNPDIIYVGTGESLKKARNFTMPGNGVYRSDDGGDSWRHLGLDDSWHIGEMAVHPDNPDIVLVCVLGHFWSTNPNRGIYRTSDGGKSWDHVLYLDEKTGANDVVFSPSDPNVAYATMWENNPGISGENSGVFKSEDGGKTWDKLTEGLPAGPDVGRMGVAVSYQDPDKAYVLVDNLANDRGKAAEVYGTLDGGKSWNLTQEEDLLIFPGIGWYFTDIYVSPKDDEEIFALGVRMANSKDGGKSFDIVGGKVHHFYPSMAQGLHLDHCEMWINPYNPNHLVLGNDGGLYVSYDNGESWEHFNNIPAGEFYDIAIDNQDPYLIYGGVQDDATVYGPAEEWNPDFDDQWNYLWIDAWDGGDGCITQVDPEDPNTVYFSMQNGAARRKDMAADTSKSIRPRLPEDFDGELRWNFISPYFISPHDNHTLYIGANYVMKSINQGDQWNVISPDITMSSDPEKRSVSAGAVTESEVRKGLLYAGTDRGAFWVTMDDGATWEERSSGLPNNYIRSITPSKFEEGRVYVALSGINYDDLGNYLFVSEDYGNNWRSLSNNLPDEIANVIIEDPSNEDILYTGLYRGVYISIDRGNSWSLLGKDMPAASVSDLVIHEPSGDLIASTHGRGIYKVNLNPLYKSLSLDSGNEVHLFEIPRATRPYFNDTHGEPVIKTVKKVPVSFWLDSPQKVTLEVWGRNDDKDEEEDENESESESELKLVWSKDIVGRKGLNQYRWDLMYKEVESEYPYFIHYKQFLETGEYEVVLKTKGGEVTTKLIVVEGSMPLD
jgi:photosystem II stability/assembly factor-like uncharacterized protein